MPKVAIIGGNPQYYAMFNKMGWETTSDPFSADLIQFTGGADVSPFIYGEKNTKSYTDVHRDLKEAGIFAIGQRMGIKMAGICRGGQFLNVMCGGEMIQDVQGHAIYGTHEIVTLDGKEIEVTSTHHQMMIPGEYNAEVIAWANIVNKTENKFNPDYEEYDTEVVWYENLQCLCFQPHPEFDGADSTCEYYFKLLHEYLGLKS